jgi:glucose/arabinose dehydrogenase
VRRATLRPAALICVVALATAGCAGSDEGSGSDRTPATDSTTEATPVETSPSDGGTESSSTGPPAPAETASTEPAASGAVSAPPSSAPPPSTTILAPSPDADLPTEAPGQSESAPVTTAPGPLPEPDVRLIELSSYDRPTDMAVDEGDPRLLVVQQGGTIVASDDESDTVVFDIAEAPGATFSDAGNEQGLLGLALHPDADLAYINFTNGGGHTVVAEVAFDPTTLVFDPTSFREVLTVDQPLSNHNGGGLAFGPDGHLYVGVGDGGGAGDPERTALDRSSRLGKLLRIDPSAGDGAAFSVPDDNPFVSTEGADPTVWATGLRNPWRFSFDSLTGDLWIADVGQDRFEEVDLAPATEGRDAGRGLNFGWSAFEGNERFNEDQAPGGHFPPIVTYPHEDGNCSISGGVAARNSTFDALNGWYVYGDFCSGQLWALDTTSVSASQDGPVGTPRIIPVAKVPGLAAVTIGPFGDVYAISNQGPTYRLAPA